MEDYIMKISYKPVKSVITDGADNITYGISVLDSSGVTLRTVSDIFDNISDADNFAKLCTELELSPEHLDDVIDDVLAAK